MPSGTRLRAAGSGASPAGLWEDREVGRVLSSVVCGALGGTLGYAARQLACRRGAGGGQAVDVDVTVPVGATAAATLVGIVIGRKAAFVSGLALGSAVGKGLDRFVPGLGGLGERAESLSPETAAAAGGATPPASDVA